MLTFIAIAATGFAAYGPPTNEDAFGAYIAHILEPVRESGDVIREAALHYSLDFPSDVVLQRCVRKQDRQVFFENGVVQVFGGYECIMEVWPNAEPSFRTSGFFRHDGFDWVYHGPVGESIIPSPSKFDSNRDKGRIINKPGALSYEGDPKNPMNPDYNPYAKFFDETGWVQDEPRY